MASTIRVEGTQHWGGKARSPSNGRWLKRATGAARKRDRSIACLEKAGHFPKRGQSDSNGVGWVAAEVLNWLQVRLANQDNPTGVPGRELGRLQMHVSAAQLQA